MKIFNDILIKDFLSVNQKIYISWNWDQFGDVDVVVMRPDGDPVALGRDGDAVDLGEGDLVFLNCSFVVNVITLKKDEFEIAEIKSKEDFFLSGSTFTDAKEDHKMMLCLLIE